MAAGHEGVLEAIFNPTSAIYSASETDIEPQNDDAADICEPANVSMAKELELEAVRCAESGNLQRALELLTEAQKVSSEYASVYNNRAQVYRLMNDIPSALADLEKAIELSRGTGIVAQQAYTQRGMIRRLQQQDELAYEDFQKAASLGGVFARHQCTQLNPYAKLCNQMLQDAFEKLQGTPFK